MPSPAIDTPDQIIDFLNLLLECERAGAKALRLFTTLDPPAPIAAALPDLFQDEARYCAGLTAQIARLGGKPSPKTGDFLQKIAQTEGWTARLDLLARGQRWVARRIGEALPAITDTELHAFLAEMQATHDVNVAAAQKLAESAP